MTSAHLLAMALGAAAGYFLGKHQETAQAGKSRIPLPFITGVLGGVLALGAAAVGFSSGGAPEWEDRVIQLGSSRDLEAILDGHPEETVLIDFYADWCGPCRRMAPAINELAEEGGAIVAVADVDRTPTLAREHNAQVVPTLVVYRGGELVERHTGGKTLEELRRIIEDPGET
ncbi:MAG: thioredoxin domain-containing protein [Candidatus Hydrogenedentota bacterium]